ncbi:MAG: monovalent cation/H(+) antiporter subunit G [Alphaproteobacteria bacterium]
MLDRAIDLASWASILAGSFFLVAGAIGVLRLPDFFTRQHAAGITDTLAATLILFGLMLQLPFGLATVKLILILLFLIFTSPTASHALAQAALSGGRKPVAEDWRKSR